MFRLCWLSTIDVVYHELLYQVAVERGQQVIAVVLSSTSSVILDSSLQTCSPMKLNYGHAHGEEITKGDMRHRE